jgi:hypothetical protein
METKEIKLSDALRWNDLADEYDKHNTGKKPEHCQWVLSGIGQQAKKIYSK